jgi:hypothetical protein
MIAKPYNFERSVSRGRGSSLRWVTCLAAVLGACTWGAGRAEAGLSPLGASKTAGEATPEQIFGHAYGGTFVRDGNNFSNGTVTATRIDDDGGAEQRWNVNVTSARAVAAFSGYNQSFGQVVNGSYQPLFDVSGKGFDVSGSAGAAGGRPAGGFTFARAGDDRVLHDRVLSSSAADNRDAADHLVSYRVTGAGSDPTYLLFWEDAIGRGSDFDHNDLVVELKAASGEALLIPLPAAAWTGLSGLAGLGLIRGANRLRRRA